MLTAGFLPRVVAAAAITKGGSVVGCRTVGYTALGVGLKAVTSVGSESTLDRWISSSSARRERSAPATAEIRQLVNKGKESTSLSSDELAVDQGGPDVLAPANSLITWRRDGAVQLRMGEFGPAAVRPISVMTLFREAVERAPNKSAYATKIDGSWRMTSFEEYYVQTRQAARSFIELGLEPESSVGILGFNSPEWFTSSFGCIFAGGFSTGIYITNSPEACRYVADHARCNIIVVDDENQLQKILSIRNQLPHLRAIVQYRGQPHKHLHGVYSWADFMDIGSQRTERELKTRISAQAPNKCCTLVYTSGTTGDPKGVMLSHDNLVWTACRLAEHTGHTFGTPERAVSYLPLSHVAAHVTDAVGQLTVGAPIYFAQPDALRGSLGQTIKEVRPLSFLGVPRVWEKMHETIVAVGKDSGPLKRHVIAWARDAGTRGNVARMSGHTIPLSSKIADRLILRKIREAIGLDQCEICVSSAAPISRSTLDFFISLNLPIVEVLGMTEASGPHTCGVVTNNAVGSVGLELPGTNTTIHEPNAEGIGEMLIHGRNVCMGYLDMKEKTLHAFGGVEGKYFYSGDLGRRDEKGFLHVSGRIKEIIVTSGGENVSSVPIENAVKDRLPLLSNCMLIGDGRNYLTILLAIKTGVDAETMIPLNTLTPDVISWCRRLGSSAQTVSDINDDALVSAAIQKGLDDINAAAVSNAQKIRKWKLIPMDFSIPGGDLGPTLKLKRHIVLKKYKHLIDSMYDG